MTSLSFLPLERGPSVPALSSLFAIASRRKSNIDSQSGDEAILTSAVVSSVGRPSMKIVPERTCFPVHVVDIVPPPPASSEEAARVAVRMPTPDYWAEEDLSDEMLLAHPIEGLSEDVHEGLSNAAIQLAIARDIDLANGYGHQKMVQEDDPGEEKTMKKERRIDVGDRRGRTGAAIELQIGSQKFPSKKKAKEFLAKLYKEFGPTTSVKRTETMADFDFLIEVYSLHPDSDVKLSEVHDFASLRIHCQKITPSVPTSSAVMEVAVSGCRTTRPSIITTLPALNGKSLRDFSGTSSYHRSMTSVGPSFRKFVRIAASI